jgi:signal transduction histidine kinase
MPKSIEILIVEDSATQAMLLQNILEKNGFKVTVARNGRLGLNALSTLRPALVISDIQMPEMDGYQLCHAIHSDPQLATIPVILLTSLSAPEDIIRGLESGADNFVVKPYDETFLLSRIETIFANQQLKKDGGGQAEILIVFAGKRYVITSDRRQILNLLLSTYETAVKTNEDLIKAHEELKAAQAQLIEAEKFQAVGRLAAGVAHEVRNPLAILHMGVEFLSAQSSDESAAILAEMKEAVSRADSVISSLMDLSLSRQADMQQTDLNGILDRTIARFADEFERKKIAVVRNYGMDLCAPRMDAGKMEQVFANIIANARDAMPEGGDLMLKTYPRQLDKNDLIFDAGDRAGTRARAGDQIVVVDIADTGTGITKENISKLFDPFYSTKPTGTGMGLGLTVAKKIIELHGGTIEVRNRDDRGVITTVTLNCANP